MYGRSVERRPDPLPLEVNDVALITAGTAVWALALVVLLVLKAFDVAIHTWWIEMCVAGFLLGLLGIRVCRRRKARLPGA